MAQEKVSHAELATHRWGWGVQWQCGSPAEVLAGRCLLCCCCPCCCPVCTLGMWLLAAVTAAAAAMIAMVFLGRLGAAHGHVDGCLMPQH